MTGALGVYDVDVPGLRILRVSQHGREIPQARLHVGLGDTLTDLEIVVGR
jgi:hypothetical protein